MRYDIPLRAALLSVAALLGGAQLALGDVTVISRVTVTAQVPPELADKAKTSGALAKGGTKTRTVRTYYKGARQRQEVSQGKEVVITDLTANKRITLNPANKTYYVVPLEEKKPTPPPSSTDSSDASDKAAAESFKSAVTLTADLQPGSNGPKTIAGKPATRYAYNIAFGLDMEQVLAKVKEEMAKEKEKADKEKADQEKPAAADGAAGEKPATAEEGASGDAKKDDAGAADFATAMLSMIPNLSVKMDGEQWVTDAVKLPARWVSSTLFGAGAFATSSPLDDMSLPPGVPVDLKEFLTKVAAIRGLPLSGRTNFDITVRFTEQAIALAKSHSSNGDPKNRLPEGPLNIKISLNNEVQSVTEAPLAEALFVVPKGYQKVPAPAKRGDFPGLPDSMR